MKTAYQRTRRFRNWMNRRCYLPVIRNGIASLPGGRRFQVRDDGWRRMA